MGSPSAGRIGCPAKARRLDCHEENLPPERKRSPLTENQVVADSYLGRAQQGHPSGPAAARVGLEY